MLFTWVQFLKEDALSFLDIPNLLELQSAECQAANQQPGSPATPDPGPAPNPSCGPPGHAEEAVSDPRDLSTSAPSPLPSRTSQPVHENATLPGSPGGSSQDEDQSIPTPSLPPSQRLLSRILINNAAQQQKRFASTIFECGVCFMSHLGSDCVKLPECGHIFCRACLTGFCKVQIAEGNVGGVACPQGDCSSAPTPAQVHAWPPFLDS